MKGNRLFVFFRFLYICMESCNYHKTYNYKRPHVLASEKQLRNTTFTMAYKDESCIYGVIITHSCILHLLRNSIRTLFFSHSTVACSQTQYKISDNIKLFIQLFRFSYRTLIHPHKLSTLPEYLLTAARAVHTERNVLKDFRARPIIVDRMTH